MAKLTFEIPKTELDKVAKERISELERLLKNAEKREERLKAKLKEIEGKEKLACEIINAFDDFIEKFKCEWGLELEDVFGPYGP